MKSCSTHYEFFEELEFDHDLLKDRKQSEGNGNVQI